MSYVSYHQIKGGETNKYFGFFSVISSPPNTIPPSSDIDVSMGIGVGAIDPELPLKNLLSVNNIICNVNGFYTFRFTRHKMVKLLTNLSKGERKIWLRRRRMVCEVRVRVDGNLDYRTTHTVLPCILIKRNLLKA